MSRWIHFKYNKEKGRYERSRPSPWRHVFTFFRHLFSGVVVGALLLWAFVYFVGSPGEWKLQKEHELLQEQYKLLDARLDEAQNILEDIGQRDDNLYRIIMQGSPIGEQKRKLFLGSSNRYDEFSTLTDAALVTEVNQKMDQLERELYIQSKSFDEVTDLIKTQGDRLKCIPAIQPVANTDLRRMASGYGWRIDPVYNIRRFHEGMDFSAETGTPVFATGNGRVTAAGWQQGYGLCIDIDHGYGYTTKYAHLSKKMVGVGQRVSRGDKIGEVGSTGKSTAPHLHYEVHLRGVTQNPVNYYFMDLTPEQYEEMVQRSENVGNMLD